MNKALIVIIPSYNAGPELNCIIAKVSSVSSNIIAVDDGSTDGSISAVEKLPVRLIRFEKNRGKGAAILAGFRAALETPTMQCTVIIDADGQHDPAELPRLYAQFQEQRADLVIGTRTFEQRNVPWPSWLGNKLTRFVTHILLQRNIPDTQSGFRLHSRRFIERIVRDIPGGRYETEMAILVKAIREGFTVVSVPIKTIYETGNPSSHFRRVRDSVRVWRALFQASLRRK